MIDKERLAKMKLVAVSRVRNDADIIEAFVRHHAVYFDKIIVLDDGSCDGTYEALLSLQAEGLPLVVLQAPVVGYEQSRYMTRLLQISVDQFGADWIAPLDVDEFIEPEIGVTFAEALSAQEKILLSIAWNNFEWRPQDDDDPEPNPVVRQRYRLSSRPDHNKVLVPACLVDDTTQLLQGNHLLSRNGELVAPLALQSVNLGHFPIRSVPQYASKVAVGYLQYSAMPNWNRHLGFHYIGPFESLLSGGLDALKERMPMDSRHYSRSTDELQDHAAASQDDPLRYKGGALKLAISNTAFLKNILHCAEAIARNRADLAYRMRTEAPNRETGGSGVATLLPKQLFAINDEAIDATGKLTSVELDTLLRQLGAVHRELLRLNDDKAVFEKRLSRMELELIDAQQKLCFQAEQLDSRTFKLVRRIIDRLVRAGINPRAAFDVFESLRRK